MGLLTASVLISVLEGCAWSIHFMDHEQVHSVNSGGDPYPRLGLFGDRRGEASMTSLTICQMRKRLRQQNGAGDLCGSVVFRDCHGSYSGRRGIRPSTALN